MLTTRVPHFLEDGPVLAHQSPPWNKAFFWPQLPPTLLLFSFFFFFYLFFFFLGVFFLSLDVTPGHSLLPSIPPLEVVISFVADTLDLDSPYSF